MLQESSIEVSVIPEAKPLVEVKGLAVEIDTGEKRIYAVNGVSFNVYKGEVVALVGESGCGKSLTALSILGLTREIPGARVMGNIYFRKPNDTSPCLTLGERKNIKKSPRNSNNSEYNELYSEVDILSAPLSSVHKLRGSEISIIFQDPVSSLNPVITIGKQLIEPLVLHRRMTKRDAREEAIRLLRVVGIEEPLYRFNQYPYQLSGGMCQRVMIAMALAGNPSLIIGDEPTTALDVTIQAQILDLLMKVSTDFRTAVLLITHNLAIVAGTAKRVIVMYAGKIVEETGSVEFFQEPHHPYSRALLQSLPRIDKKSDLISIPGQPPDGSEPVRFCPYAPRCERAKDICWQKMPELEKVGESLTACFFPY